MQALPLEAEGGGQGEPLEPTGRIPIHKGLLLSRLPAGHQEARVEGALAGREGCSSLPSHFPLPVPKLYSLDTR